MLQESITTTLHITPVQGTVITNTLLSCVFTRIITTLRENKPTISSCLVGAAQKHNQAEWHFRSIHPQPAAASLVCI